MKKVTLGNKVIHNYSEPFIIAEIGSNHNGDMELAKRIIDEAKACGADAVKFQSWDDKTLVSAEEYRNNQSYDDSPKKHFGSLKEMVKKYYLREEQHFELKKYCDELGIIFSSSPFSAKEVDLLEECEVPFFKIASMDINNFQLLDYVATKSKPVILSTGMSTLGEIETAVKRLQSNGCSDVILLHCISIYPPEYQDIHLNNIKMLQQTFNLPVGFSDHTIGTSIPLASVALGACVIEKHFTIDKDLPGWDHEISADPQELKVLVKESSHISKALGSFKRTVSEAEEEKKKKFRRSAVALKDLKKGEKIDLEKITFKRPGTGIQPNEVDYIIGKSLNADIKEDELINWKHIE